MKVQYVSSVMRVEDFADLFMDTKTMPGQQAQRYHRLMIEGIAANQVQVEVITGVPITRKNYRKMWFSGRHIKDGDIIYRYLPTLNIPGIKNINQMLGAFCSVLRSDKKSVVICDVLNASVAYGAALATKLCKKKCVGIITDLPQLMVTGTRTSHIRLVNMIISLCTHYVLLTEQMNNAVNPAGKPYVIIEGLSDYKLERFKRLKKTNKKCIYAGLLDERYGVKKMVEAFILANVSGVGLHIYGNGPYTDELCKIAEQYSNVIYHGNVMNEEVIKAEREATLLVNPRPTCGEFTKYSFPSKNMEYMASGTAVLTTRLSGMPKEYYDKVYFFEDESVEGMASTFINILSINEKERERMGESAMKFVKTYKNNIIQAEKLLHIL